MRAWAFAAAALTALVAASAILTISPPRPKLRVENFPQVRLGMTQAEVESVLGVPPGDYAEPPPYGYMRFMTRVAYMSPPGSVERVWSDDCHRFEIYFDAGGRVVGLYDRSVYSMKIHASPVERLRRWLGI